MPIQKIMSIHIKNLEVYVNVKDSEKLRHTIIENFINSLTGEVQLLDVGAGMMPYKTLCESHGFTYTSHDFEKYRADKTNLGLFEDSYLLKSHDLVCDILEIPLNKYTHVICTEVLEHVPDPVAAFKRVMAALTDGGMAIFSVPLRSQIHQAPYFFCSGFSPYFFIEHSKDYFLLEKMIQIGDELDSITHEFPQLFNDIRFRRLYFSNFIKAILFYLFRFFRNKFGKEFVSSGGIGLIAIVKKI